MSVFAFYDHTSAGRFGPGLVFLPAQRVMRRVLRPAFHRLRDLLQLLFDRQQAQADVTNWVSDRVAVLESVRATERLDALEAVHLGNLQAHREMTAAYDRLAQAHRDQVAAHKELIAAHKALLSDHLAAARRVVLLEDLLLQATADGAAPWVVPMAPARGAARLAS